MDHSENLNVILVLVIGTLALLLMAVAIIFFVLLHQRRVIAYQQEMRLKDEAMQKELLYATIQSQESEQRRIARDLHDELGPLLSAVKLKLSQVRNVLNEKGLDVATVEQSREMLDGTIVQVRNISHSLLPPILEDMGLTYALENSCNKMNSAGLAITYHQQSDYSRLPHDVELAIYRVVMELLNNVIKHSGASNAQVELEQSGSELKVTVTDNGQGFDTAEKSKSKGLGLKSIQSRSTAIGASIEYNSSAQGTSAAIKYSEPPV